MKWVFVLGMLVTGTVNTITKSLQNSQRSVGLDGHKGYFHFPWTQTLIMYYGEMMCMFAFLVALFYSRRTKRELTAEEREINQTEVALLIKPGGGEAKHSKAAPFLFLIPTMLDLIGTTLAGIGLLNTYVSVFQMLRGSIIVFSGLLSVVILKRKLLMNNWIGIAITVAGLVIVGWSSMLDDKNGAFAPQQLLFGNALVVAGQFANALQMILEEIFLKKRNFPPLLVVGAEGCWGAAVMMLIVLPALYYIPGHHTAHYENALDAAVQIKNNFTLLLLVLGYWLSIAFYNFCGLSVAKKLTSVHRTFIDALRTIFVWGVSLILWYASNGKIHGEPWGKHSYIQLVGFVLLVCGTAVYNNVHVALFSSLWPVHTKQPTHHNAKH